MILAAYPVVHVSISVVVLTTLAAIKFRDEPVKQT